MVVDSELAVGLIREGDHATKRCLASRREVWRCVESPERTNVFGHQWEPAEGKVVDIRFSGQHGTNHVTAEPRFLMDVQPAAGEPFRAEISELPLMFSFKPPAVGQVVKLECDTRHKMARFVRSDPAINKQTDQQALKTSYEAELHSPQATFTPPVRGATSARLVRVQALVDQGLLTSAQAEQLAPEGHVSDTAWESIRDQYGE